MCDFTLREYGCDPEHKRYIASRWCEEYSRTHKRCNPLRVCRREDWRHEVCGDCKERSPVDWEFMIQRNETQHKIKYSKKIANYYCLSFA
ncbi:hypothetical protein V8F20_010591 [Naviculisporaceae sp. PSN 640]